VCFTGETRRATGTRRWIGSRRWPCRLPAPDAPPPASQRRERLAPACCLSVSARFEIRLWPASSLRLALANRAAVCFLAWTRRPDAVRRPLRPAPGTPSAGERARSPRSSMPNRRSWPGTLTTPSAAFWPEAVLWLASSASASPSLAWQCNSRAGRRQSRNTKEKRGRSVAPASLRYVVREFTAWRGRTSCPSESR
jgi:hypothetical protein